MSRLTIPLVALVGYLAFHASILLFLAFLAGVPPVTIDGPATVPLPAAIAVDLALIVAFGLQHSVMARPAFKRAWTRICPAPLERTLYVLASSLALALLCLAWQPLPGVVWDVAGPARLAVWIAFGASALLLVAAGSQIDALALAGVRQALEHAGWLAPRPDGGLVVRGLYRWVRHPIATGWFAVLWITPTMSAGHLLLAIALSGYVVLGTALEERALVATFGDAYRRYRAQTGAFLPRIGAAR